MASTSPVQLRSDNSPHLHELLEAAAQAVHVLPCPPAPPTCMNCWRPPHRLCTCSYPWIMTPVQTCIVQGWVQGWPEGAGAGTDLHAASEPSRTNSATGQGNDSGVHPLTHTPYLHRC